MWAHQRISDEHLETSKRAAPIIVGGRISHMFTLPFAKLDQQGLKLVAVGDPVQPCKIGGQRVELHIKVLPAT